MLLKMIADLNRRMDEAENSYQAGSLLLSELEKAFQT
jgi:hypothetical protein